jgi:hypothetical protein
MSKTLLLKGYGSNVLNARIYNNALTDTHHFDVDVFYQTK